MVNLASHNGNGGFGGHWGFAVVGALWIIFGSVQAARPDITWRMRRWQYRNPEAAAPSDKALQVARIVGAVIAVAGVVLIVVAFATA